MRNRCRETAGALKQARVDLKSYPETEQQLDTLDNLNFKMGLALADLTDDRPVHIELADQGDQSMMEPTVDIHKAILADQAGRTPADVVNEAGGSSTIT